MTTVAKAPADVSKLYSIKVDNIAYRTTQEDLWRIFSVYGDVGDVHIPRDMRTHKCKGFAFVRFKHRDDASDAKIECDGRNIDGRIVRVEMAVNKRPIDKRCERLDRRDREYSRKRHSPDAGYRSESRSPRHDRRRHYSESSEDNTLGGIIKKQKILVDCETQTEPGKWEERRKM